MGKMVSRPTTDDLRVVLEPEKRSYTYGEPLKFHYRVQNHSAVPLFLVEGKTSTHYVHGKLQVRVGISEHAKDALYFQYKAPNLLRIEPGHDVERPLKIVMPIREAVRDGNTIVEREVDVDSKVHVSLAVGYFTDADPQTGPDPVTNYLHRQHIVSSGPVSVHVGSAELVT
jgi:hypothetical protein